MRSDILDRLARRRFVPLALGALSILLLLPALGGGFQLDDHFQRPRLLGYGEPAIDLFVFYDGEPDRIRDGLAGGWLPWWTTPDFRHASLRYLSVLTMQLDYLLWPETPWLMHLHSLLWLGALVAASTLLYRLVLTPAWAALLAALLYALDDAHALPTAYLANRNALVASALGVVCLWSFARYRGSAWRPGAFLAPLFLALALAAGEIAVAVAGYLFAYALFLDTATPMRRLRALTPCTAVLVLWAAVYKLGGFGASGSGFYVDPGTDPLAFLQALWRRAPLLLLGQWTPIPADWGSAVAAGSAAATALHLAGLAVAGVLAFLVTPLLRQRPAARFWALGALLSLLPVAATGPQNRLLFFVGLGSMALLAQLAAALAIDRRDGMTTGRFLRLAVAGTLLLAHLVLAPTAGLRALARHHQSSRRMLAAIDSVPDDDAIREQDLVLVNPPDAIYTSGAITPVKAMALEPTPRRLRTLVHGGSGMRITRLDGNSLRIELDRGLFPDPFSRYYRGADRPFEAGQRVTVPGLEIEVEAIDGGGAPKTLRFRFARPLEDPSLRFLVWRQERYHEWRPPALAERIDLEAQRGIFR